MDGEHKPAEGFPVIIGATYEVEAPPFRNASLCRPWLSQVHEGDVAHEIHEFEQDEKPSDHIVVPGFGPGRRSVIGMKEEVHINEAE